MPAISVVCSMLGLYCVSAPIKGSFGPSPEMVISCSYDLCLLFLFKNPSLAVSRISAATFEFASLCCTYSLSVMFFCPLIIFCFLYKLGTCISIYPFSADFLYVFLLNKSWDAHFCKLLALSNHPTVPAATSKF